MDPVSFIDRRKFLGSAAALGCALAGGAAPGEEGKKGKYKKAVKFGMVRVRGGAAPSSPR